MSSHKEIRVRDLEESDFGQIIRIVDALPQWFSKTGAKQIKVDLKYQRGLVAIKDATILGFLTFYVYEAQALLVQGTQDSLIVLQVRIALTIGVSI